MEVITGASNMLRVVIILGFAALILGYFVATNWLSSQTNTNQIITNVEKSSNQTAHTISILQTYVVQSQIKSEEILENQRTLFMYLDNVQEQLREINATVNNH